MNNSKNSAHSTQLTAHNLPLTIIIEETAGIDRIEEHVTFGIPFPVSMLKDESKLRLYDSNDSPLSL